MTILFRDDMSYLDLVHGFSLTPEWKMQLEEKDMSELPDEAGKVLLIKEQVIELDRLIRLLPLKLEAITDSIKEIWLAVNELKK